MKRTRIYSTSELRVMQEAVHAATAQHHAAEQARGRTAVEDDPDNRNHTPGVAAWMIQIRRERIALDTEDLERRIEHGVGGPWTFRLMDRIADVDGEVAYWEGVRDAATFRLMFRENLI